MNSRALSLSLWLVMLISLLSGCATVDQKINLTYKTSDQPIGQNSGDLVVSRVDAASMPRNTKGEWIIGSLNNTNGVKQADLLSDKAFGEWISDALVQELKHAGYNASYSAPLPAGVARGVVINDMNVFMNVDKGTVSAEIRQELKFNVDIILNGSKVKTFSVATVDKKTLVLPASPEEKEQIMRQSLQDAVQRQIMPDLIVMFNKK